MSRERPLFKTSYMGFKVRVYINRLEYKFPLGDKTHIPLSQISSVSVKFALYAQVVVETTAGAKHKLPVAPGRKEPLRLAIISAQESLL